MARAINVFCNYNNQCKISRGEIIEWVNRTLKCEINKVEELCTAAVYCQFMDMLFPGSIVLNKVKFKVNQEYEFVENLKLLQGAFDKVHVNKPIPIELLVKGRYQDNYEFAEWFKKFFDANFKERAYDPIAARKNAVIGIGPAPKSKFKVLNNTKIKAKPAKTQSVNEDITQKNTIQPEAKQDDQIENKETLIMDVLQHEIQFYLEKLLQIEELCKKKPFVLSEKIKSILYKAQPGFETPV